MKWTGCGGKKKTERNRERKKDGARKGKRVDLIPTWRAVCFTMRVWEGSPGRAVDAFTTLHNVNGVVLRLLNRKNSKTPAMIRLAHLRAHANTDKNDFVTIQKVTLLNVYTIVYYYITYLLVNAPYARRVDLRDTRNLCLYSAHPPSLES